MTKYDKNMRSKGKVVDDFENELKAPPKPKNTTQKKAKVKTEPSFNSADVTNVILLKDDTTRKIIGVLLICFSLFSAASLISFLLYWKTDLSIIQSETVSSFQVINNFEIKNWMGLLGAKFGYNMIYKGFGLLSLIIPVFAMHFGLILLIDKKLISTLVWMKYVATTGIWFVFASGSLFNSISPVLGGGVGFWMFNSMREFMGLAGTILVILVTGYGIMWLVFKYEPIGLTKYFEKMDAGFSKYFNKRRNLRRRRYTSICRRYAF